MAPLLRITRATTTTALLISPHIPSLGRDQHCLHSSPSPAHFSTPTLLAPPSLPLMSAHEVLDLVSDSDGDGAMESHLRPPTFASLPPSSTVPPPKRRKLHLTHPDASNTDDALSLISLSSDDTPTPRPHRRPHRTPSSSDDDDEEVVLSDEESNLITPSIPSLSLSLTPSSLPAALTSSPADGKKRRKKAVARYFGEDPTIKCYNCGGGGHEAADCTKARVYPPCYICGQSLQSHERGMGCPNELCFRCGGAGHQSRVSRTDRHVAQVVDDSKFEIRRLRLRVEADMRTAYHC